MKKSISLCLAFLMLFSFCACGPTADKAETTTPSSESSSVFQIDTESEMSETTESEITTESATETTTQSTTTQTTLTEIETTKPTPTKASTTVATTQSTTATTTKAETTTEKKTETTVKETESTTEDKSITCYIEISCETINNNKSKLKENKKAFVPKSGVILKKTKVKVDEGSSAFDVFKKGCEENVCSENCVYCKKNGIHFDFVYTPGYDSNYIRGIHQIYEKDCGTKSGWLYSVNDEFQNQGCNKATVKSGDIIKFVYTCDMGEDVGADI